MNFKICFIMISIKYLIVIESSLIINTLTETDNKIIECQNLDKIHMENIYSEYLSLYRKYEEKIFQKEILLNRILEQEFESNENHLHKRFFDNSQCDLNERNRSIINQQSLCPWKYEVIHRMDKYPHYRAEVKCTCEKCLLPNKNNNIKNIYGCQPVFKHVPVLLKRECASNGYFKWLPSTEEVNYACVCASHHKWFPFI